MLFTVPKFTYLYVHLLVVFLIMNRQCMVMKHLKPVCTVHLPQCVPDTGGDTVPDTGGDTVPDTGGDTVPDTGGDTVPDTLLISFFLVSSSSLVQ